MPAEMATTASITFQAMVNAASAKPRR
jgi:hypothetical protein